MDGDEEDEEQNAEKLAAIAKLKAQEQSNKELFRDADGNIFNPEKKFGIIEDNSLIYDNITTAYPVNLPTDYY